MSPAGPAASPPCRWLRALPTAAVLAAACAAFGVAELALRAGGRGPWDPQIEAAGPEGAIVAAHPTRGYVFLPGRRSLDERGRRFTMTHLPNSFRITRPLDARAGVRPRPGIWVLGCSFAHGWALNDEETFPWQLQVMLPDHDVSNLGASGYGTLQSLVTLEETLRVERRPEVVVLAYASFHDERNAFLRRFGKSVLVSHSLEPFRWPYARLTRAGLRLEVATSPLREVPLLRRSALVHALEILYDDRFEDLLVRSHAVTLALLDRLIISCRDRGIAVVVADLSSDRTSRDTLAHCQAAGAATVDVAVDLSRPENNNLPYDSHPSPRAARLYAERLGNFLATAVRR